MNKPICYQYKIVNQRTNEVGKEIFAKGIDDLMTKIQLGKDGICIAICGWRIKEYWEKSYSKRITQIIGEEDYKEFLELYNNTK